MSYMYDMFGDLERKVNSMLLEAFSDNLLFYPPLPSCVFTSHQLP